MQGLLPLQLQEMGFSIKANESLACLVHTQLNKGKVDFHSSWLLIVLGQWENDCIFPIGLSNLFAEIFWPCIGYIFIALTQLCNHHIETHSSEFYEAATDA